MKIQIGLIKSIMDTQGNQGPQKRITFTDLNNKTISGWVSINDFNASDWVSGGVVDVELKQNGKYTNFKLVKGAARQQVASASPSASEALDLLRKIYADIQLLKADMKNDEPQYPDAGEFI